MKDKYCFFYDKANGNRFVMHTPEESIKNFKELKCGLYYMDTIETSTVLINTIKNNKNKYTNNDYSHNFIFYKLQKRMDG